MKTLHRWLVRLLSPAILIILLFALFLPRPAVRSIATLQTLEVTYQGETLQLSEEEQEQICDILSTARCHPTYRKSRKGHDPQPVQIQAITRASPPMQEVTIELGNDPRCTYPQARWQSYHLNDADHLWDALEPICQAAAARGGSA